jgi:hypothetical protein
MKTNTAPGPDGFSVMLFKKCWVVIKHQVKGILDDLRAGGGNLGRINYGVMSLIPKFKGASDIRQFRPIAVLNVIL